MGHKWLEAFSKAVTYLGSGVTALTGTMQAAQQQEQIDAAWAALLHTPDAAVVSETSTPQAAPIDELRDYLERAGITAPVPDSRSRERPAAQTTAPQASLAQEEKAALSGKDSGAPAGEKPWEIDPPAEALYNAVQDTGEGLTGGDIAEAQERAKELDEAVHGGPLYGEYGDLTPLRPNREPIFLPKSPEGVPSPIPPYVEKSLALPPSNGTPSQMLTEAGGDHFQGTYTLKPNQTYTANGATYHTDGSGAIRSWSATLTGPRQAAPRSPSHQKNLPGKLEGDHAGHYLAASEGGSGLADNLAPMDAKVNTRDYRAFERENHKLLEEGYTVRLDGSSHMGSSELRPDGIMVTRSVYDSDGTLVDREHFSWTNTDMSKYQGNDFGDPSVPNAMDESLDKAGMTREEIAALEEAEQEPANSGKQMEMASRSQTGAASDGQAERTDDKTDDAGKQPERNTSEAEQNQRERQEGKDPEGAEDASGQETDNGQKTRQPEQRSCEGEQTPPDENKTGDRRKSEQNTPGSGRESPERKNAGKDQTPSGEQTEESGKKSTGQEEPEADQKQPDQSQEAEHLSQTARGKTVARREDQTSGQKAGNDGQQEPWKRSGGREAELPKQADQPREPWRRKGPDQDSSVEKDGQEDGRQPQGTAPAQTEKPNSAQEKEPLPAPGETPQEPWRKEDNASKPQQEDPKEESKDEEPPNKPQEPPKQKTPSHDDGPTNNKNGGYHY